MDVVEKIKSCKFEGHEKGFHFEISSGRATVIRIYRNAVESAGFIRPEIIHVDSSYTSLTILTAAHQAVYDFVIWYINYTNQRDHG